jgi:alpha-ribazole phosphatase
MEVYLIRHTKPKIEKGICYGQSDVPLSDSFEKEAEALMKHLPAKFNVIYSSPLTRCHKLAKLIANGYQPIANSLKTDTRLMEMNFGDWELKNWDAIDQSQLNNWMQDFVSVKVPNGENFEELYSRVNSFVEELLKQQYEKVAIVTHAGVIRSIVSKILEVPLKNAFKLPVDYSSVTKLNISGDGCYSSIEFLNKL